MCPNLYSVNLIGLSINDESLIMLARNCEHFYSLNLADCGNITDRGIIKLRNIKDLNLNDCPDITDMGTIKLAKNCPNLRCLEIIGNDEIDHNSIVELAKCCRNLQKLDLSNCMRITDKSLVGIARYCPNMISNILDTDPGMYETEDPEIYHTQFSYLARLMDKGIIKIAENRHNLEELSIRNRFRLNDNSIIRIADNCRKLRTLNLSMCLNITDNVIRKLVRCPKLRSLNLSCNEHVTEVTEITIVHLLEKLNHLENLLLYNCGQISHNFSIILRNCYPNITTVISDE